MPTPTTLREKLASEIAAIHWPVLEAHHRRGALFVVDPTVELADVATAIAEDRSPEVQGWLEAGHLGRPTDDDAAAWAEEQGARFLFVIVQPYVLAQRVAFDAPS